MKKVLFRLGIALLILCAVLYLSLLLVPFLPFPLTIKVGISTGLVIAGEVCFWVGSVLVGKELIARYKDKLNPRNWFRRKSNPGGDENGPPAP